MPAFAHTEPAAQSFDVQHAFVQKRPASSHALGTMPAVAHAPVVHTVSATHAPPSGTELPRTQVLVLLSHALGAGQFVGPHV